MEREPVTGADVVLAADAVADLLAGNVDLSVPAGGLEWDCRTAVGHVASCLIAYAGQVGSPGATGYLKFSGEPESDEPGDLADYTRAAGRILAATAEWADRGVRAFHPYGASDPEGFAGMGCVEALVHGYDVATGLGAEFDPPRDVCERVLARMFPDATGPEDPWNRLLWATGRISLPGRSDVAGWRWRGAPLESSPA